jgi:hypothetical protein
MVRQKPEQPLGDRLYPCEGEIKSAGPTGAFNTLTKSELRRLGYKFFTNI